MGAGIAKPADLSKDGEELSAELSEWLAVRQNTLDEIERVASELETFQKQVTYGKLAGGLAGVVGGGIALGCVATAIFTGGASLLLTGFGLSLAAGGGVASAVTEVFDTMRKRTKLDAVQRTLEKDKSQLTALLDKFETAVDECTLDADRKRRITVSFGEVLGQLKKLWVSGTCLYGWAKTGKAIYAATHHTGTAAALVKIGAKNGVKRLLTYGGGVAGSVFVFVDLAYVLHYSLQIGKGSPSEAAKALREVAAMLKSERDKLVTFFVDEFAAPAPSCFT